MALAVEGKVRVVVLRDVVLRDVVLRDVVLRDVSMHALRVETTLHGQSLDILDTFQIMGDRIICIV